MIDSSLLAAIITGSIAFISALIGFFSHLSIFKCCSTNQVDEDEYQFIEINLIEFNEEQ